MVTNTTTKWHQERCPRCGGNLYQDTRTDDSNLMCLQCGRTYPFEVMELSAAVDEGSLTTNAVSS